VKQACARLNFEQFLYALKQLSLEIYPIAGQMQMISLISQTQNNIMELTHQEVKVSEHKAFFTLISLNIIKNPPKK
jgi:hypothetical protein